MSKSIAIKDVAVATPTLTSVTPQGTVGTTHYSYAIVAEAPDGELSAASAAVQTTTGNATLTGVNKNHLVWTDPAGAARILIYRTASQGTGSQATTGLIGAVAAGTQAFDDTGLTGDNSVAPASNKTGVARGTPTYLSGSGFTPGRTVGCYVNGQWAGAKVVGPYGVAPAAGNFGAAAYGALSGNMVAPDSSLIPTPGASTLVAVDMTDGSSATTPITTT